MSERHHVNAAVFVQLVKDGKTFLLRRANTGWADGFLTLPSGHVDKGDSVVEAAVKEVREEAGVTVKPEDLEFIHVHYVHDVYVNFYFRTSVWEGEPYLAEPELCSEVMWVEVTEIPSDTIMHVRKMLEQVTAGNHFSEIDNDPNPS